MSKVFLVFAKNDEINKDNALTKCIFLQEKFSFMAFFFTFFWLLYHKLWSWVFFYIVFATMVSYLQVAGFINENLKIFILLANSLYIAISATTILQKQYLKKGYSLKSIIRADSKEVALSKLLLSLKIKECESKQ